jgi:hypothetical protein
MKKNIAMKRSILRNKKPENISQTDDAIAMLQVRGRPSLALRTRR